MAFYCSTMLAMALELARGKPAYGDIASKFFEHYVAIAQAMNTLGGTGLWNEDDGFYYDLALFGRRADADADPVDGRPHPAVRGRDPRRRAPGPAAACSASGSSGSSRTSPSWRRNIACMHPDTTSERRLLAIPTRERLTRVLGYMLDERELLSPFGIRSLSKAHGEHPYRLELDGQAFEVHYTPGESDTGLFGGNSNWRGPVWLPVNYLLDRGAQALPPLLPATRSRSSARPARAGG